MMKKDFTQFDIFVTVLSLLSYVVDVGSDILLIVTFLIDGHQIWAALSMAFVALSTFLMQIFSFSWHVSDRNLTWKTFFVHALFLAPAHRYFQAVQLGIRAKRTKSRQDLDAVFHANNDICLLRLIECFVESAPQLILQLYIILRYQQFSWVLGLSTVLSLTSIAWSMTAYTDGLRLAYKDVYNRKWLSMLTQTTWQTAIISARVMAIVVFATLYQAWIFLAMGIHWCVMTFWITLQNADFGETACEKRLFNSVSGFIYIFCFLNLKDSRARWRILAYHVVILGENSLLVLLWFLGRPDNTPVWMEVSTIAIVFGGYAVGGVFMMVYYSCCHPTGPQQDKDKMSFWFRRFGPRESKPKDAIFDVPKMPSHVADWLNASVNLSLASKADCLTVSRDQTGLTRPQEYTQSLYGSVVEGSYNDSRVVSYNRYHELSPAQTRKKSDGEFTTTGNLSYISASSSRHLIDSSSNMSVDSADRSFHPFNRNRCSSSATTDHQYNSSELETPLKVFTTSAINDMSGSYLTPKHTSHDSFYSSPEFKTTDMSPLDAKKLWEESQNKIDTAVAQTITIVTHTDLDKRRSHSTITWRKNSTVESDTSQNSSSVHGEYNETSVDRYVLHQQTHDMQGTPLVTEQSNRISRWSPYVEVSIPYIDESVVNDERQESCNNDEGSYLSDWDHISSLHHTQPDRFWTSGINNMSFDRDVSNPEISTTTNESSRLLDNNYTNSSIEPRSISSTSFQDRSRDRSHSLSLPPDSSISLYECSSSQQDESPGNSYADSLRTISSQMTSGYCGSKANISDVTDRSWSSRSQSGESKASPIYAKKTPTLEDSDYYRLKSTSSSLSGTDFTTNESSRLSDNNYCSIEPGSISSTSFQDRSRDRSHSLSLPQDSSISLYECSSSQQGESPGNSYNWLKSTASSLSGTDFTQNDSASGSKSGADFSMESASAGDYSLGPRSDRDFSGESRSDSDGNYSGESRSGGNYSVESSSSVEYSMSASDMSRQEDLFTRTKSFSGMDTSSHEGLYNSSSDVPKMDISRICYPKQLSYLEDQIVPNREDNFEMSNRSLSIDNSRTSLSGNGSSENRRGKHSKSPKDRLPRKRSLVFNASVDSENNSLSVTKGSPISVHDMKKSPHRLGRNIDLFNVSAWRNGFDVDANENFTGIKSLQYVAPVTASNKPLPITNLTESPYKFRPRKPNLALTRLAESPYKFRSKQNEDMGRLRITSDKENDSYVLHNRGLSQSARARMSLPTKPLHLKQDQNDNTDHQEHTRRKSSIPSTFPCYMYSSDGETEEDSSIHLQSAKSRQVLGALENTPGFSPIIVPDELHLVSDRKSVDPVRTKVVKPVVSTPLFGHGQGNSFQQLDVPEECLSTEDIEV